MKENLYEPCHLHENQYLQIVCQQCKQACLACPMCIDQFHTGHQMISLKKFIAEQIPKLYQTKPNAQKVNKGIQKMKRGFLDVHMLQFKGFELMRKSIGYEINQIEQEYSNQAQILKRQIEVVCGKGSYNVENITAIKHKIEQNLKIPNQQKLQTQFDKILTKVNALLDQTTHIICKSIKDLKQYWQISYGVILNSQKKYKHYFSQKNKHQLIELKQINKKDSKQNKQKEEQKRIALNKTFDNKYHIAIVQPVLNPFKNQVKFKIQESINNCVWLGVCDLNRVKEKGFQNCYKKNQGCYWIWQSGGQQQCQFFSSLLEQSISLQCCIKVGDIISVKLQYTNDKMNKIHFYKVIQNNQTLIYTGEVQKKQLYACVALGDQFQKVSIYT